MQLSWLVRGLRTGILTTRYPRAAESMPDGWRGVVEIDPARCGPESNLPACVAACLPGALSVVAMAQGEAQLRLEPLACIACGRCLPACPAGAITMTPRFELAKRHRAHPEAPGP